MKIAQLSAVNKILGAALGILKSVFFLGTAIILIESMDDRSDIIDEETKSGSLLYNPAKTIVTTTIPAFKESSLLIKQALQEEDLLTTNE